MILPHPVSRDRLRRTVAAAGSTVAQGMKARCGTRHARSRIMNREVLHLD
jgi:hypothetical protein